MPVRSVRSKVITARLHVARFTAWVEGVEAARRDCTTAPCNTHESGTPGPRCGSLVCGYDSLVTARDTLAIDGGAPVRTEPLSFSKGAALLGPAMTDAA